MRAKKAVFAATLLSTAAAFAQANGLEGKVIELEAGDTTRRHVPVSVPYDGAEVEGRIIVQEPKTSVRFPAQVHDGELVFISEGGLPGTTHRYVVQIDENESGMEPRVQLREGDTPDTVEVYIEDEHFTTYVYSDDYQKPFLWPVKSKGGVPVTRDYPMKDDDIPEYARDHPHHKSLYSAYGDINGVDIWTEGRTKGTQNTDLVTFASGDAFGWLKAENTWVDRKGEPLVDEEREYRFYAVPDDMRYIDVRVTFTASHGDAKFGDTKEGGIVSLRMRHELSYAKGTITNSHGDVGERYCWGKPSAWCDYSGELPEHGWRGVTVFDHPGNLRHPTSWHVRTYGLMGANCFGWSYFSDDPDNEGLLPGENGDYLLKDGESLTFNYRVYVHAGSVEEAKVAERYADYATPPTVRWAAK